MSWVGRRCIPLVDHLFVSKDFRRGGIIHELFLSGFCLLVYRYLRINIERHEISNYLLNKRIKEEKDIKDMMEKINNGRHTPV